MYIVKMFEIVFFSLMSRTIIYFHVYITLDFPITYRNALVQFFVNQNAHAYIKQ